MSAGSSDERTKKISGNRGVEVRASTICCTRQISRAWVTSRGNRPIELRPYLLGRAVAPSYDITGTRLATGGSDGKAGLDAKVGVSPTLTADLTLNTDFAQVEADQQVINLTRFPTFFPEKREFFLESSGLFDIGTPERVQLFYSRRIGLDTNGAPVPILGGARMYGKQGPWSIGLFDARTGGSENANDVAVRVGHDLLDRSTIAAMFVDRSLTGRATSERGAGVDLDFPLVVSGHNVEPHFWLMGTRTPAAPGTPARLACLDRLPERSVRQLRLAVSHRRWFRADDRLRAAHRHLGNDRTYRLPAAPRHVRHSSLRSHADSNLGHHRRPVDGDLSRPSTWQTADFEWHAFAGDLQSGDHFEVNVQRDLDAPTASFDLFRDISVAPGRYWWTSGNAQYETSAGRPVSLSAVVGTGQFYDGHSSTAEVGGTVRGGGHVIVGATYSVTSARLSAGAFTATQLTGRLEYAFSTRASFLGFAQYQNEDRRTDFNLRFHWIPTIGDDVYVVWNSGFTTDPIAPWRFPGGRALSHPLNGALIVKAVHRLAH